MNSKKITVILVDDHAIVRAGFRLLLATEENIEVIAEAERAIMEKFIKWCHRGPITARLDHVEIIELPIDEVLTTFEIK